MSFVGFNTHINPLRNCEFAENRYEICSTLPRDFSDPAAPNHRPAQVSPDESPPDARRFCPKCCLSSMEK